MERAAYLEALAEAAAGLLAAARRADPDAGVPCCPEWTAADLVWHIGEVHDFWGRVVRDGEPPPAGRNRRPDTYAGLIEFAAATSAELQRVLAAAEPVAPAWNWSGRDQTVGWVLRRMTQDTAVHRVDAVRVDGGDHRLDVALAADGIDEFLTYHLYDDESGAPPFAGSLHLHCTDADGEWTVTPDGEGITVTRDHAKADAALRGEANDLLMVLWRRLPLDAVTVFGDAALAAAFVDHSVTD